MHQEENFSSSVLFQENIDEVPPAYFENCICIQCKFQKFNFNDFPLQHMFSKVIRKHIFCNSWYQTSNYAHDKCDCWYSNFLELLVCIYIIYNIHAMCFRRITYKVQFCHSHSKKTTWRHVHLVKGKDYFLSHKVEYRHFCSSRLFKKYRNEGLCNKILGLYLQLY